MLDIIKDFFRTRKLRKHASNLPTGIIPLSEIRTANVVIDVEEAGFELLKNDILTWGKASGIKVEAYNGLIAVLTALTIVVGMRLMGAMMISSLIVFPALSAMRVFKSFFNSHNITMGKLKSFILKK